MAGLASALSEAGASTVSCFRWSGRIRDVHSEAVVEAYADHLRRLGSAEANGRDLCLVAKSYGALIVEQALRRLDEEVQVDVFLRLATPDRRTAIDLGPPARLLVDVVSNRDRLHRFARFITPYLTPRPRTSARPTPVRVLLVRDFRHEQFNHPTVVTTGPWAGRSIYDLYSGLLARDPLALRETTRAA